MATESIQEKRARLLNDGGVQERIRRRSFEIYSLRMRHRYPGDQNSDWLQAESEVLDELLAQEIDPLALLESVGQPVAFGGALELEITEPVEAPVAQATEEPVEKEKKKAKARSAKSASPRKPKAKTEAVEGEKKKAAKSATKKSAAEKTPAEKTPKKTAKKSPKAKTEE